MLIEKHGLTTDHPEYKDRIHELKLSDTRFAKKFDDYNDLDKEIIRIEDGIENTSDDHLESLKVKRVHLKDELVALIND